MIALIDARPPSPRERRSRPAGPAAAPLVAAIGFFDGLHRGHRAMISDLEDWATEVGGKPVAITFDRHPSEVLGRRPSVPTTSLIHRLVLLARAGLETTLVLPFDTELASWSPEEFVSRVLHERLGARRLLLGFDSAFGRGRSGTFEYLKAREADLGIEIRRAEAFLLGGKRISSTFVREALSAGDIRLLESLLGRPFSVLAEVRAGDRRGRTLGFPTANLVLPEGSLPPPGVYFARAARLDLPTLHEGTAVIPSARPSFLPAVVNIGRRPTFGEEGELIVETHILDLDEDLYGRHLEVEFLERHRDEMRFSGVDQLVAQIRRDVDARLRYGNR
jgi:riboflavin kinase / FMN adenylyltransferase